MMKAKEMFEELGYGLENIKTVLRYSMYIEHSVVNYLEFYIKDKDVILSAVDEHDKSYRGFQVTPQLQQAITQQMKELGWLDE